MILVFINELGPNFRGDNIYEFIFSDIDDVYGDDWDSETANGKPTPPHVEFIKKVGLINGVDPRNFQNGYEYEQALRTSFNPTGNEDLIRTSQAQAADALRDKGFTGAFDPREITVFDESDVKKIKQQELYKDLDDALSIQKIEGGFEIGVHIADVSYFVAENTGLD